MNHFDYTAVAVSVKVGRPHASYFVTIFGSNFARNYKFVHRESKSGQCDASINHTIGMAVVTPTDRSKSVRMNHEISTLINSQNKADAIRQYILLI